MIERDSSIENDSDTGRLLFLAAQQDTVAVNQLFTKYRDRLKRVVSLRLNSKLNGRVDGSDIVQEVFADASIKLAEYASEPRMPVYLWLRHLTCLKIAEAHRTHLGTQKRDARREISVGQRNIVDVDTVSLAGMLASNTPSVSDEAIAMEQLQSLQKCLEDLEPIDRELITMKHFEQMTILEISQVFGIPRATIGRQYLRALKRLRNKMDLD